MPSLTSPMARKINPRYLPEIARTFEKRTNIDATDDNKLLVAGLAIKLK